MEILFVTSNENKAAEIQAVLGRPIQRVNIDLPELQAVNVRDVIEYKTQAAYMEIGKPVLVEDTSLAVKAWNGLPGALIRWFMKTIGNEGICRMLKGYENVEAVAEVCIGYFDGHRFFSFSGIVEGEIVRIPRGSNGFGWDSIFLPNGCGKTFAEMTVDEKDAVSMRKIAALKLKKFLDEQSL